MLHQYFRRGGLFGRVVYRVNMRVATKIVRLLLLFTVGGCICGGAGVGGGVGSVLLLLAYIVK